MAAALDEVKASDDAEVKQAEKSPSPSIFDASGFYERNGPQCVLDGRLDTWWNAGHVTGWDKDNWVSFEFPKPVRISLFSIQSTGDGCHDPKTVELQVRLNGNKWVTEDVFSCQIGTDKWQSFACNGILGSSCHYRVLITERASRYQAYVQGIKFKTVDGDFDKFTRVEREYLEISGRKDGYPNERVSVIETNNTADLGRLTALSFLEWVVANPHGVIGLPTGKTPEMFIKYLRYFKNNWGSDDVIKQMKSVGIPSGKGVPFPDTTNLKFVQLDEFFPISPDATNSFLKYVKSFYVKTLGLKAKNVFTIDLTKIGGIFDKWPADKIFPDNKVDLELFNRPAKNDLENIQKLALKAVRKFCENYEANLRKLGGYGFFLGGIGHDGHIAFNFKGCDRERGTRLVKLNYQTAAQSAGDFGGISNTRGRCAITVGLSSIVYNPDARIIIMAAGEKKALRCRDAIEKAPCRDIPASVLHQVPGARFYLTRGASSKLIARRTEDVEKACFSEQIQNEMLYRVVIDLALHLKKELRKLVANDFISHAPRGDGAPRAVYRYWVTRKRQSIASLIEKTRNFVINSLEMGLSLPCDESVLHTSPHHDDVMLAYHEATDWFIENNTNNFVYLTSGFTSVHDDYCISALKGVLDGKGGTPSNELVEAGLKMPLSEILAKFKAGYVHKNESQMRDAEKILVLRRLRMVFPSIESSEQMIAKMKWFMDEYVPTKPLGKKDSLEIQKWKGMIRESECDRLWDLKGITAKTHVHHLRSQFYTGDFFNPLPKIDEDCLPMVDLYKKVAPKFISVALDPEGTGPDTHFKVLQVVAQALRLWRERDPSISPVIWGYRNVWHRFHLSAANLAIPVNESQMAEMHQAFMACFGCQRQAEFPSPEFDGPFSVLSERFHRAQLDEARILLGSNYFDRHSNKVMRDAKGIILLKEMNLDSFLKIATDLRDKIVIHQQL